MKCNFIDIVGQTITGVAVREEPSSEPRTQLYLIFPNERNFEFYFPESLIFQTAETGPSAKRMGKIVLGVGTDGGIRTGLENGSHSHYPAYNCEARVRLRSFCVAGERHFNLNVLHVLLGRTITGVLNYESQDGFHRLWILLDNATFVEIEDQHRLIRGCGGIDKGGIDEIRRCRAERPIIFEDLDDIVPSSSTVQ